MNLCPIYLDPFRQILLKTTGNNNKKWIHQIALGMTTSSNISSRKRPLYTAVADRDLSTHQKKRLCVIDKFQNDLDHLFYEWQTISIVLQSLRNAFPIKERVTEEHLDQIDKELSIAYDDLTAQVRQLDRRLNKIIVQVNQQLISTESKKYRK